MFIYYYPKKLIHIANGFILKRGISIFWFSNSLLAINACITGKEVRSKASYSNIDSPFSSKKLYSHQGTRYRCICSPSKYGNKAHTGKHSCRQRNKKAQCITQSSTDKK